MGNALKLANAIMIRADANLISTVVYLQANVPHKRVVNRHVGVTKDLVGYIVNAHLIVVAMVFVMNILHVAVVNQDGVEIIVQQVQCNPHLLPQHFALQQVIPPRVLQLAAAFTTVTIVGLAMN